MTKPLPSGIYGLIGSPGSGKSYKAVREIAFSACTQDRPIYTNIPIVPKRLRAYIYRKLPKKIKGHAARRARANLVKSITRSHFIAFCERLAKIDETAERVLDEWGSDGQQQAELAEFQQTAARDEAMRRIAKEHGEPIIIGRGANWIPPGSVLFLDELHKWFPSKAYKEEPKAILDFTSMHRHMQLKVIVISQRWMNVSLSFRSMAREVWFCMNYSKKPVLGFLKFDRWVNIFRYMHFNGEDIEEKTGLPRPGARPVWSEMVWPELNGGVEYGCYKSFSHAGTLEQQAAEIDRVTSAMLGRPSQAEQDKQPINEDELMPKKPTLISRSNSFLKYAGVIGLSFAIGRCTTPTPEAKIDPELLAAVKNAAAVQANPIQTQAVDLKTTPPADTSAPAWKDKKISSMANNWVLIEGKKYELGDSYDDLLYIAADTNAGITIWFSKAHGVQHWAVGSTPRPGQLPKNLIDKLAQLRPGHNQGATTQTPTPSGDVDNP